MRGRLEKGEARKRGDTENPMEVKEAEEVEEVKE
jgi:hypothetical protein